MQHPNNSKRSLLKDGLKATAIGGAFLAASSLNAPQTANAFDPLSLAVAGGILAQTTETITSLIDMNFIAPQREAALRNIEENIIQIGLQQEQILSGLSDIGVTVHASVEDAFYRQDLVELQRLVGEYDRQSSRGGLDNEAWLSEFTSDINQIAYRIGSYDDVAAYYPYMVASTLQITALMRQGAPVNAVQYVYQSIADRTQLWHDTGVWDAMIAPEQETLDYYYDIRSGLQHGLAMYIRYTDIHYGSGFPGFRPRQEGHNRVTPFFTSSESTVMMAFLPYRTDIWDMSAYTIDDVGDYIYIINEQGNIVYFLTDEPHFFSSRYYSRTSRDDNLLYNRSLDQGDYVYRTNFFFPRDNRPEGEDHFMTIRNITPSESGLGYTNCFNDLTNQPLNITRQRGSNETRLIREDLECFHHGFQQVIDEIPQREEYIARLQEHRDMILNTATTFSDHAALNQRYQELGFGECARTTPENADTYLAFFIPFDCER